MRTWSEKDISTLLAIFETCLLVRSKLNFREGRERKWVTDFLPVMILNDYSFLGIKELISLQNLLKEFTLPISAYFALQSLFL